MIVFTFIRDRLPQARVAAIMGAVAIGGTLIASSNSSDAASEAAGVQANSSAAEISERQRQFDIARGLLKPWVDAGAAGMKGQQDLIGLNGPGSQQSQIDAIKGGAEFNSLTDTGRNAILAAGSATGGLRGGNINGALAQYDQSVLSGLIDKQYNRYTGISNAGQNAAAGTANAAITVGNQNAASIGESGAAQAGGILGQANATNSMISGITNGAGIFLGGYGRYPGVGAGGAAAVPQQQPVFEAGQSFFA